MANRSKKVVLSVRVDPYLKDALDLLAKKQNKKIVETVESLIRDAVEEIRVINPFLPWLDPKKSKDISLQRLMGLIWSDHPIIYKLRLAHLSHEYLDEPTYIACCQVWSNECFIGNDDIFLYTRQILGVPEAVPAPKLNIGIVTSEWGILMGYGEFVVSNKPLIVTYEQYKKMLPS